jgi:phage baseplate assembly protein W
MAAEDSARAFLGTGWAFPPRFDAAGRIAEAAYEDDVREAIRIILSTSPGERVMRPDFGAGLERFVFEPVNPATVTQVETAVRDALVACEPRIDVLETRVTPEGTPPVVLLVDVQYRVRATNALQNLVYPFYLEEGPVE